MSTNNNNIHHEKSTSSSEQQNPPSSSQNHVSSNPEKQPVIIDNKYVFTLHFPFGLKKSVFIRDLEVTVKSVLEPIFDQRNMLLEDYIGFRNDGKNVNFNAKISTIEPLELTITGVKDTFTMLFPHGEKKTIVLIPKHTLRYVLDRACSDRNLRVEDFIITTGMTGRSCDLDITLGEMNERSVTLTPIVSEEKNKDDNIMARKRPSFLPHLHLTPRRRESEESRPDAAKKKLRNSKSKTKPIVSSSSNKGSETDSDEELNSNIINSTISTASQDKTPNLSMLSPREPAVIIPQQLLDSLEDPPEFSGYTFPVFEVPLEKLVTPENPVPYIVRVTIKHLLNENAILTEGLFRESGSGEEIQMFRRLFDEGKEISFSKCSYHDVAGLLKEFFRKLPDPLIPKIYDQQVKTFVDQHRSRSIDEQQLLSSIKYILEQLPTENFNTLKMLIHFLTIIIAYSDINMMRADNLIKCIVPSIRCIPAIFYYTFSHFEFFFVQDQVIKETNEVERRGGRGRREQGTRWFPYRTTTNNTSDHTHTLEPLLEVESPARPPESIPSELVSNLDKETHSNLEIIMENPT